MCRLLDLEPFGNWFLVLVVSSVTKSNHSINYGWIEYNLTNGQTGTVNDLPFLGLNTLQHLSLRSELQRRVCSSPATRTRKGTFPLIYRIQAAIEAYPDPDDRLR